MFLALHKDTKAQTNTQDDNSGSSVVDDTEGDADVDIDVDAVVGSDVDVDVDVDVNVNVDEVLPAQKPHFLDYDAVPPPDFEERFDRVLSFGKPSLPPPLVVPSGEVKTDVKMNNGGGEHLKLDKKYERDGEISDFELAASGYTKKEFTQDDNTLHLSCGDGSGSGAAMRKSNFPKPKHFLDENPIPPDYMLKQEMREHRSLDRNFDRQNPLEQQQQQQRHRTESPQPPSSLGNVEVCKSSLDRSSSGGSRCSRERYKEPSYTLSRFLDSDPKQMIGAGNSSPASLPQHSNSVLPMVGGSAWTDSFDSRYGSLQLPSMSGAGFSDVQDTLGSKVECVYSLLSMLGSNDPLEMSKKFLELSRTPETCATLRRSGCIPLLVQMMHSSEGEENVRKWAGMALHNVVHSHPDEKAGRREAKVLRLLDQIIDYCNFLKTLLQSGGEAIADDSDRHPLAAISSLMKVSFDEEHRHAMCELGALQAIPNLVHLDHAVHGPKPEDQCCNSLRRYALMALTNLTFGDENNKALLCSQKLFMEALVAQLDSAPDDLLQVTASVLRNLSWRADVNMKAVLNEIGTVTALARAAMKNKCENTLKAILSALWNLSAHCSTNKAEFCAVDGALAFLVKMLTYEGPSKTLKIIENAGGILRNVSSHIAVREHYRQILREHNCLAILLQQLKSESLTVVSNSCGTLWNLSARCPEDQKFLWDNGAVPMLRSLIHSKHAMISEGSSSALKNLLNFRPSIQNQSQLDPIARSMGLKKLPTLNARKQKALEQELEEKEHAETCDNLDVIGTGVSKERSTSVASSNFDSLSHMQRRCYPLAAGAGGLAAGVAVGASATSSTRLTRSAMLTKSESRDSIFSAKSDSVYENLMRSHSASDANRVKSPKLPAHFAGVASTGAAGHVQRRTAFVALENEVEPIEEQPIDYSIKYNENSSKRSTQQESSSVEIIDLEGESSKHSNAAGGFAVYQETDLDQPTDFSLRYAENQIESDADISPPDAEIDVVPPSASAASSGVVAQQSAAAGPKQMSSDTGNEILLILEDSVKCYQTEDTPYVISNAASVTDLRTNTKADNLLVKSTKVTETSVTAAKYKYQRSVQQHHTSSATVTYGSGTYTPEKPINYCEEGTPGYFSRYESLSSLDESPPSATHQANGELQTKSDAHKDNVAQDPVNGSGSGSGRDKDASKESAQQRPETPPKHSNASATQINSALETPLMFSRHSSMDSLVEEEDDIVPCDDKSSVISDFSRLASGVISPSEIPDSPTQSMPQSPRRNSTSGHGLFSAGASPSTPRGGANLTRGNDGHGKRPLRSVFEDDLNTFHVENTPAQFSCATSLSNLSIMDDEHQSPTSGDGGSGGSGENGSDVPNPDQEDYQHRQNKASSSETTVSTVEKVVMQSVAIQPTSTLSDGEEEEEEESGTTNNDDLLLASCINMGMNRTTIGAVGAIGGQSKVRQSEKKRSHAIGESHDEPRQYYTEDTPALLSKVGSNTNLSAISICSSSNEPKAESIFSAHIERSSSATAAHPNRQSLNLSDDVSSNASESGGATGQSFDILEQCIRDGMKKPQHQQPASVHIRSTSAAALKEDPIAMMRRGGSSLPPYLPVTDEMSRYKVEDSPCNFSVVSGLSNLTVGSSLVGPAVQLQGNSSTSPGADGGGRTSTMGTNGNANVKQLSRQTLPPQLQEDVRRDQQWQDDSLSSLSIDSEDDTNLLSQAIAAGCNRPKSNLGFSTTTSSTSKRSSSLSASQPIPINAATSASSLASASTSYNYQRQRTKQQHLSNHINGNESFSSVDSSDSNDNQSKSLFELCIMTGMQKTTTRETRDGRKEQQPEQHQLGASRYKGDTSAAHATNATQSNPNLKQPFESLPLQHQQQHHSAKHNITNRHLRERERKDEKLLLECINTGISKKIGSTGRNGNSGGPTLPGNENTHINANVNVNMNANARELPFATSTSTGPKNVPATSAAALEPYHQMAATTSPSAHSTAAPDVEKNVGTLSNSTRPNSHAVENENRNRTNRISPIGDTTNALRSPQQRTQDAESPQNRAIEPQEMTNGIGYREMDTDATLSNSLSMDNTTSDESNQSFIMETTVSLEEAQQRLPTAMAADKHKDPDLMLKSVERLTLEFVSSAEQLRTNGSGDPLEPHHGKRLGSISIGGASNSNNTWNEDTCPNDVSFPSVSVSAPVVASLNSDDDEDADDDEQATDADHKELHDFAEITPTNEEPAQPSLTMMMYDETDIYIADNASQPNSLGTETETDTLVVERTVDERTVTISSSGSSGINFQLGGEVQSAAAVAANRNIFFNPSNSAMTNSTIMAIEARALAENLELNTALDDEECIDLTFSMNSLDLDNIRPPSGMDSLNMSGYYQDLSPGVMGCSGGTQPNSLQRSGLLSQMSARSPKLPRKSLPAGLMARRALGQLPGHLSGSAESVNSSCNLLDNIKPPSLMDELLDSMISVASIQSEVADCESMATTVSLSVVSHYETAAGCNEFEDNTVTLQSCYDHVLPRDDDEADDDDGTAKSSTPLPSDCDFSSAESTPKKYGTTSSSHGVRRTLTPKQKRKMAKDRFKTYTIAADIVLSEEQMQQLKPDDETLRIEITDSYKDEQSPKRNQANPDRYRTQTIECPTQLLPSEVFSNAINGDELANCSLTSTDDCLSDDVSSIRAMTRQFKFITGPAPVTNVSPAQQPVPHRDHSANLLESSEYCDQNSETESCHEHEQHNVLNGNEIYCEEAAQDHHDEDADVDAEGGRVRAANTTFIGKARITKPGDAAMNKCKNDEESNDGSPPKAVRGCKKPAYVSPYSMQYQRNTALVTRLATNKLITPTSTNNVLRKRNPNVIDTAATTKLAQKKKTNEMTSTQMVVQAPPVPALERQGTFVKEEPSISPIKVPVVTPNGTVAAVSPQSSPSKRTSKLPMKQHHSATATTAAVTRKIPGVTAAAATATSGKTSAGRRVPASGPASAATVTPQRSNSTATIRVTSNAARIAMLSTRVSATTPPSRSNSNLNTTAIANSAATAKIHQAQSRIAGIWKRVDEAKKATKPPAPAQPRTSNLKRPSQQTAHQQLAPRQPTNASQQKQKLIRSSTFDNNAPAAEGAAKAVAAVAGLAAAVGSSGSNAKSKIAVNRNIAIGGAAATGVRHITARK